MGKQQETPEQAAARRAADAERKRKERAAKKEAKAAAASTSEISAAETVQDFWAISIKSADPGKLVEWKASQEYVEALMGDIRTVLEERQPDDQFIEDVDKELRDDIAEFGVTGVTVPLLIGKYWQNPSLLEKLTSGDTPSSRFAKFGVLTALDDYSLSKWETFITAHRRSKQPRVEIPTASYVSLKCSLCNAPPTAVQSAVAEAYRRTNSYVCATCLEKRAKIRNFAQEQRSPEHQLFDSFGRVLDQ